MQRRFILPANLLLKRIPVTLLFFVVLQYAEAQDPVVGILVGGYDKCTLRRAFSAKEIGCRYGLELYPGDLISHVPNLKKIQIDWLAPPYTYCQSLNETTLQVIYKKPKEEGLLTKTLTYLGFLKSELKPVLGTTRGLSDTSVLPGTNVSVLLDTPITFHWPQKGGISLNFHDVSGELIYKKLLDTAQTIELTPREIGMKPSEICTWKIEGVNSQQILSLRLVSERLAIMIRNDLREIEKSKGNKRLLKAIYFQFISDEHPNEINMYWLSHKLLNRLHDNSVVDILKRHFTEHQRTR